MIRTYLEAKTRRWYALCEHPGSSHEFNITEKEFVDPSTLVCPISSVAVEEVEDVTEDETEPEDGGGVEAETEEGKAGTDDEEAVEGIEESEPEPVDPISKSALNAMNKQEILDQYTPTDVDMDNTKNEIVAAVVAQRGG
jgi:hypothetical protein